MSADLMEMLNLFYQNINDIDTTALKMSLKYAKDREYQLHANYERLVTQKKIQETLPYFVNQKLEKPEEVDFGLTQLCLPQNDTYEAMPPHKWRKVCEALQDVTCENDIQELIEYCNSRYLYFGWEQMREAMMILGRPAFRSSLWRLAGPKVSETENYPLIMEVLQKQEQQELKKIHW